MKEIWNGKTITESNDAIIVEGNHYFLEKSVNKAYLKKVRHAPNLSLESESELLQYCY